MQTKFNEYNCGVFGMFLAVFGFNKQKSWEKCQQIPEAHAEKSQFWKIFNFDKNFKEFYFSFTRTCAEFRI